MRGFPPVQIFILGLAFALLAFPLAQLTTGYEKVETHQILETDSKKVPVPTLVRLRFAHRPLAVSLKLGDKELIEKPDLSASLMEFKTEMDVSHEGIEFLLTASWPTGTPATALTVEVEPDGFELRSETRWSAEAALNELITFLW